MQELKDESGGLTTQSRRENMARNIWMWKYTGMSSGGPTEGAKHRLMKDPKGTHSSKCFRQFNMLFFFKWQFNGFQIILRKYKK